VVISHYVLVVGFQLLSSLFIHNQLDALSLVRLSVPNARFLFAPLIAKALNIFHSDCTGNPLAPISTGKSHTRHPFCLHCSCRLEYLALFLSQASSQRDSQGTVSSTITRHLSLSDQITMSRLNDVWIMFGNASFCFKSTDISHLSDSSRMELVGCDCLGINMGNKHKNDTLIVLVNVNMRI